MIITEEEAKRYPFLLPHDRWYGATEIPQGWHDIVIIMCEEIKVFLDQHNIPLEKYHCNQGKEKCGEFEWYDSFDDIEQNWFVRSYILNQIVCHYKHILNYTCTQCGKQGIMRHRKPHVEPLCDECFNLEMKNNYKEIVRLLNSPDKESVILGLSYFRESELAHKPMVDFKKENHIVYEKIDEVLDSTEKESGFEYLLDDLIWELQNVFHIEEFKEYNVKGSYDSCDSVG